MLHFGMSCWFLSICSKRQYCLAAAGWLATGALLVVGVPLLLRMPLWSDVTLYDVSAREMLKGGVHYRDVFDTNPPGFPWLLVIIRAVLGKSALALRLVDLAIVVAIAAMLIHWCRACGASRAGVAWMAASIAAFYPFAHEFNHVQRDCWMMLPALTAILVRLRRMESLAPSRASGFCEGLLWGMGVWIKPQLLVIAALVWFATAVRLGPVRQRCRDLIIVVSGGSVAGLIGLGVLVASGSWPYFLDVWMHWNTSYASIVFRELPYRVFEQQLVYFRPYSIFSLLAVPLAIKNLRESRDSDPANYRRAVLGGTYLAWLCVTLYLQRGFHYAHVPETLLMLALFAANRWPIPAFIVLIQIIASCMWLAAGGDRELHEGLRLAEKRSWWLRQFMERNAAFDPQRTRWWAACFDRKPSREAQRGAALYADYYGCPNPVELGAVADYLREQQVRDGELIAWHDSPHALYLELDIKPGFRFMHVCTAWTFGVWQRQQVFRELEQALPHARFAVSDMHRITVHCDQLNEIDADGLPRVLPQWQREVFPFNQPVVFRSPSGRYLVHSISRPVARCDIAHDKDQERPGREGE